MTGRAVRCGAHFADFDTGRGFHVARRSSGPARRRLWPLLLVLAGLPAVAQALGLGRIIGEPILGDALQVEVALTGAADRSIDADCVTLRRPSESIDADYFPRDLVSRIERQAGSQRLLLSTRSALRTPLIEFRVSITCGYNLYRDYLLMVSPREGRAAADIAAPARAQAVPPASAAVAGEAATSPGSSAAVAPPVVALAGSAAPLPDGIGGRNFDVQREMTLEELARLHFPGPLRQERFMRWVAEANPQLFSGAADLRRHRLAAGQTLLIPDGVPPRRPGDHQNGSSPLDATGAAAAAPQRALPRPPAEAAAVTAARPRDGNKDRLVVGGGSVPAKDTKETMELVDRLTAMMEQQLSAQNAANEKVRQLEEALAELTRSMADLQADVKRREAIWQAERKAAQAANQDRSGRDWWQLLMAVVAGGALGAGVLQGIRRWPRRQSADGGASAAAIEDAAAHGPFAQVDDEQQAGTPASAAVAAVPSPPAAVPTPAREATGAATAPAFIRQNPSPSARPQPPAAADTGLDESPVPAARALDPLQFEPPAATAAATPAPVAPAEGHGGKDAGKAAIELAGIMVSMGLAESAAETLVAQIRDNPRESLQHWLKLLEIYRISNNREEFERSTVEMRQYFNVQAALWSGAAVPAAQRHSIEAFPHLRSEVIERWRQPGCATYLYDLLLDHRDGTRAGFPQEVAEEILLLVAIASDAP